MKKIKCKKNIFLLLCLLVTLLLVLLCCKKSKEPGEKFEKYYRIIDHLSEENIIKTPFKSIFKEFRFVKEDISRKWEYIPALSQKNIETWAAATSHPILGTDERIPGEEVRLLENGGDVTYLTGSTNPENEKSWEWIKTSEDLHLGNRDRFNYNKRLKGIVINTKQPFRFEKFLPAGEVTLILTVDTNKAPNRGRKNKRPILIVSLGDKYEKRFRLSPKRKIFKIRKNVEIGLYNIEIKIKGGGNIIPGKKEQQPVVLKKVRINSNSDIILYTKKPGQKREPPRGKFQLLYYSHDSLGKNEDQSRLAQVRYLYQLKDRFPIGDSGIESNPFSIKKKITIGEYSLNSLAAPPASEFSFHLTIPKNCKLEFGYGFLNESGAAVGAEKIVTFKVVIESSSSDQILFDEHINLLSQPEFFVKKIDLSLFENKEVELSFITEIIKPAQKIGYENVPVWINPILYQPSDKNDINIVLISLDTVRPDYLGCYGYSKNTSPGISKFSEDAVLFLNAYSTTSWTLPAHISLLTSLNCLHHQVYYPYEKMHPDSLTLADILRNHHFYSAAVTGGGFLSSTYGFAKGFDVYHELRARDNEVIRADEAEYLARQSLDFITKNKEKQFFLFLHTYQPHDPYNNPSPLGKQFLFNNPKWGHISLVDLFKKTGRFNYSFSEEEKRNIKALYEGEIRYTDEVYVTPIIDLLKKLKIYDRTMLILLSDHGEEFYDHEAWLHDHSLYEEAIKIPLLIKFPYSRHKGKKVKSIVRIIDVLPTILDELNIKTDIYKFDGQSLLPLVKENETKQRTFLSDLAIRGQKAPKIITVNRGNLKFILNEKVVSPYVKKAAREFAGFHIELYDLDKDPAETLNLAHQARTNQICIDLIKEIRAMYKNAQRKPGKKDKVIMDKGLLEKLKALGYIE